MPASGIEKWQVIGRHKGRIGQAVGLAYPAAAPDPAGKRHYHLAEARLSYGRHGQPDVGRCVRSGLEQRPHGPGHGHRLAQSGQQAGQC